MKLNERGLPEPGRELDAWIAENILGFEWRIHPSDRMRLLLRPKEWEHWQPAIGDEPIHDYAYVFIDPYSTTHAYHQVMEAMRGEWSFEITLTNLYAWVTVRYAGTGEILATESITPSKLMLVEEMAAHTVCACVWKAKGDDDD